MSVYENDENALLSSPRHILGEKWAWGQQAEQPLGV